jgi:hypothetical protein
VPPPRGSGVTPGKIGPTTLYAELVASLVWADLTHCAWRRGQESIGRTEVRSAGYSAEAARLQPPRHHCSFDDSFEDGQIEGLADEVESAAVE